MNLREKKPEKLLPQPTKLADSLKNENSKLSIAEIVTKARKENFRIIYKKEVEPLNEIAFKKLSNNFSLITNLKNLDEDSRNKVYDMMDISSDIENSFVYIDYENYWRRACYEHFRSAEVLMHGDNWKQCYAENYVKEVITNFNENSDLNDLIRIFIIMKNHIFNLEVPYFSSSFDVSLIPKYFINIAKLDLRYSPKLLEKNKKKESIFVKQIIRKFRFI
jgi:hypothetical protein